MERMGVSRTTLREALRILEDQGLIIRKRGRGTYVSERPIINDLSQNYGVSEMISRAGLEPGTLCSESRIEIASSLVVKKLEIPEGTKVFALERVRTADGSPVVWSTNYAALSIFRGNVPGLDDFKHNNLSLFDYVIEKLQLRIVQGIASINPVLANKLLSEKLQVNRGTPLLLITQIDYDTRQLPLLYSVEYYLPEKITFVIHRKGPHY